MRVLQICIVVSGMFLLGIGKLEVDAPPGRLRADGFGLRRPPAAFGADLGETDGDGFLANRRTGRFSGFASVRNPAQRTNRCRGNNPGALLHSCTFAPVHQEIEADATHLNGLALPGIFLTSDALSLGPRL